MAMRASETFFVVTKNGKQKFETNVVVPKDIAKGREHLVYDDTKPQPIAEPHVGRPREPRVIDPTEEAPADE